MQELNFQLITQIYVETNPKFVNIGIERLSKNELKELVKVLKDNQIEMKTRLCDIANKRVDPIIFSMPKGTKLIENEK